MAEMATYVLFTVHTDTNDDDDDDDDDTLIFYSIDLILLFIIYLKARRIVDMLCLVWFSDNSPPC